jgi:hypothetical protein
MGKAGKILLGVGMAVVASFIVGGTMYLTRDKKPVISAAPVAEAKVSPWEVFKARVEGNEFFRCQQYDDCRGYVVRGKDPAGTKVTGVLGSDGSLTITITSELNGSSQLLTYTDSNGDGNVETLSGSNFPGAASVGKMPENLRKEAAKKYENLIGDLVKTADKVLEDALYGAPK